MRTPIAILLMLTLSTTATMAADEDEEKAGAGVVGTEVPVLGYLFTDRDKAEQHAKLAKMRAQLPQAERSVRNLSQQLARADQAAKKALQTKEYETAAKQALLASEVEKRLGEARQRLTVLNSEIARNRLASSGRDAVIRLAAASQKEPPSVEQRLDRIERRLDRVVALLEQIEARTQ